MEASFLEIYNETIKDLLGSGDVNVKHEIKLVNPNNTGSACEVMVTNVKTVIVTSETQVSLCGTTFLFRTTMSRQKHEQSVSFKYVCKGYGF